MFINIDTSSGIPIYMQIESQIKYAIASGAIKTGDVIPSIRRIATELRVNPNTVARAYQNLERDGVFRTARGTGTYVSDKAPSLLKAGNADDLRPIATQLVIEAIRMRIDTRDIHKLVDNLLIQLGVKK